MQELIRLTWQQHREEIVANYLHDLNHHHHHHLSIPFNPTHSSASFTAAITRAESLLHERVGLLSEDLDECRRASALLRDQLERRNCDHRERNDRAVGAVAARFAEYVENVLCDVAAEGSRGFAVEELPSVSVRKLREVDARMAEIVFACCGAAGAEKVPDDVIPAEFKPW
jgi:hypothetical protein